MKQTRWNRWDLLDKPASNNPGDVDIVIVHYNDHESLAKTLTALEHQLYPLDKMHVTVADDGSQETPRAQQSIVWNSFNIVRQEDLGFRAGTARNLGAKAGHSPTILFLDCDVVPSPGWVEGHMAWHRKSQDAITFGRTLYVDAHQVIFDGQAGRVPAHILGHLLRTNKFLSGHDDLFYAAASGNFGVSRVLFHETGGFDEDFYEWGGEDLDLAFRLFTLGADLIPAQDATAHHLGQGTSQTKDTTSQREYLGHYIPHRSLSVPPQGRKTADIQIDMSELAEQEQTELAEQLSSSLNTERFKLVTDKHFPDLDTLSPLQIKTSTSNLPINQIDRLVAALGGNVAVFEFEDGTQIVTTRSALKTHRQTGSVSIYAIAKLFGQLDCSLEEVRTLDSRQLPADTPHSRLRSFLGLIPSRLLSICEAPLRHIYAAANSVATKALAKKVART